MGVFLLLLGYFATAFAPPSIPAEYASFIVGTVNGPWTLRVFSQIHSAGIQLSANNPAGDDALVDISKSEVFYRESGTSVWIKAHGFSGKINENLDLYVTSLFYLKPATSYEVRAVLNKIVNSQPVNVREIILSFTTQIDEFSFTPENVITVDDDFASNDPAAKKFKSIQSALDNTQTVPGTRIVVKPGIYYESITISKSGEPGKWIQILGEPGVILDGHDPALENLGAGQWQPYSNPDAINGENLWQLSYPSKIYSAWRDGKYFYRYVTGSSADRTPFSNFLNDASGQSDVCDDIPYDDLNYPWHLEEGYVYDTTAKKIYLRLKEGDTPNRLPYYISRYKQAIEIAQQDWIWIEGLTFQYYGAGEVFETRPMVINNGNFNIIRKNSFIRNANGVRIYWTDDNGNMANNDVADDGAAFNRIEYNTFSTSIPGNWLYCETKKGAAFIGIDMRGSVGNIIRHNELFRIGENSIQAQLGGSQLNCREDIGCDKLYYYAGFETDVYGNYIHDNVEGIENDGPNVNSRIYENYLKNMWSYILSLQSGPFGPHWLLRNIYYNNVKGPFEGSEGFLKIRTPSVSKYAFLYHNTYVHNREVAGKGDAAVSIRQQYRNIVMRNNIFTTPSDVVAQLNCNLQAESYVKADINYNTYFTSNQNFINFEKANPKQGSDECSNILYSSRDLLCSAEGKECRGKFGDPGFTSATDFSLKEGSTNTIDQGLALGILPFIQGSSPDIGALEFGQKLSCDNNGICEPLFEDATCSDCPKRGDGCPDADGDGYSPSPSCSSPFDCDDIDPGDYPGAPEECNNDDENCDGQPDDGLGQITCGVGACTVTVNRCSAGVLQGCMPRSPEQEICNNEDDDCDRAFDEDENGEPLSQGCAYSGPVGTGGVGVCKAGRRVCTNGEYAFFCEGEVTPAFVDQCGDNLDNNCNGETDEGCGDVPCTPTLETCNGLNDDCDQLTDEDENGEPLSEPCAYPGDPGTEGKSACRAGRKVCGGGIYGPCLGEISPSVEECDNLDNDCDGQTDENFVCDTIEGKIFCDLPAESSFIPDKELTFCIQRSYLSSVFKNDELSDNDLSEMIYRAATSWNLAGADINVRFLEEIDNLGDDNRENIEITQEDVLSCKYKNGNYRFKECDATILAIDCPDLGDIGSDGDESFAGDIYSVINRETRTIILYGGGDRRWFVDETLLLKKEKPHPLYLIVQRQIGKLLGLSYTACFNYGNQRITSENIKSLQNIYGSRENYPSSSIRLSPRSISSGKETTIALRDKDRSINLLTEVKFQKPETLIPVSCQPFIDFDREPLRTLYLKCPAFAPGVYHLFLQNPLGETKSLQNALNVEDNYFWTDFSPKIFYYEGKNLYVDMVFTGKFPEATANCKEEVQNPEGSLKLPCIEGFPGSDIFNWKKINGDTYQALVSFPIKDYLEQVAPERGETLPLSFPLALQFYFEDKRRFPISVYVCPPFTECEDGKCPPFTECEEGKITFAPLPEDLDAPRAGIQQALTVTQGGQLVVRGFSSFSPEYLKGQAFKDNKDNSVYLWRAKSDEDVLGDKRLLLTLKTEKDAPIGAWHMELSSLQGGSDSFLFYVKPAFQRGDVNEDGRIDLADAVFTLNYLFRGSNAINCEDAADTNDDGKLDLSDVIYLLNYLFIGGRAPPEPFDARGVDSTLDGLSC